MVERSRSELGSPGDSGSCLRRADRRRERRVADSRIAPEEQGCAAERGVGIDPRSGGTAPVCGRGLVAGIQVHGSGQILVDGRFGRYLYYAALSAVKAVDFSQEVGFSDGRAPCNRT